MALETREAIGALTETWRRWGHEIGFGIGIAHGFATLGTIGFEGRFDRNRDRIQRRLPAVRRSKTGTKSLRAYQGHACSCEMSRFV
jgi:hypothetical protein